MGIVLSMATGNSRNKVALKPGFSQMHWMMKVQSDSNISGRGGKPPRPIRMEEVALHCTEKDAWTVFRGRVYNITPYLHYHPGGVRILLKCAGKDCTEDFDLYHAWVNAEGMIGRLYLGDLIVEKPPSAPETPSQPSPTTPPLAPSSMPKPIGLSLSSNCQNNQMGPLSSKLSDVGSSHISSEISKTTDDSDYEKEWINVADASQLHEEDSRLLVQVPSKMEEKCNHKNPVPINRSSSKVNSKDTNGRYVALVRCDGKLHAIDATCYHMGGPLLFSDIEDINVKTPKSKGSLNSKITKETCLDCPWHHYKIRLSDGHRLHLISGNKYEASEEPKQRVHQVKEVNGRILVHLLDNIEEGVLEEVASDGYAFKKPAPAQRSSKPNKRSGAVYAQQQRVKVSYDGVTSGIQASMKGGDGVAPWATGGGGGGGGGLQEEEEEKLLIGYEYITFNSKNKGLTKGNNGSVSMMLSSHFNPFTVKSITNVGKDMKLLVFNCLPSLRSSIAFRGRHLDVKVNIKNRYQTISTKKILEEVDEITRPYTPIIRCNEFGMFSLLIKGYEKGMLSKYLVNLKVGDAVEMRGPFGGIDLKWFDIPSLPSDILVKSDVHKRNKVRLLLLGAGTGVTPHLQLIYGVLSKLKNSSNSSSSLSIQEITLITFNRTEADIPMRSELDALPSLNNREETPNIKVFHALSSSDDVPEDWQGLRGRVSEDLLQPFITAHDDDCSTLRMGWCGPDGFHLSLRDITSSLGIDLGLCHEFF